MYDSKLVLETNKSKDNLRLSGYFCFGAVFNVINSVLSEIEITLLEKVLDFAHTQRMIDELRQDFNEFCRRMHTKWFFRNEPTLEFSQTQAFSPKSTWQPAKGLEVFLCELEKEIFKISTEHCRYSDTSREERRP